MSTSLFLTGRVYITPGVRGLMCDGFNPLPFLRRHKQGDWGDIDDVDKDENNVSVNARLRIFSGYDAMAPSGDKVRLWIITEADRSYTTILLPDEY